MSSAGARSAAVPVSNARAEASRRNGARSRGPKTPEGKARSAQKALMHGLRAEKHVVLPQEDAAEFAAVEAALVAELVPVGALQTLLARRVAVGAWRLARADRLAAGTGLGPRSPTRRPTGRGARVPQLWGAGAGVALMRDGNGTRSFETLLRYRNAAMAEFTHALRTLKALQADQAVAIDFALEARPNRPAARPSLAQRAQPNQPENAAGRPLEHTLPEPAAPRRTCTRPRRRGCRTNLTAIARQTSPNVAASERPSNGNGATAPHRAIGNARHGVPRSHGPSERIPNQWLRLR